jgi:hypothetical protein
LTARENYFNSNHYYKQKRKGGGVKKIFKFYLDGFKNMKVGKTLWAIILLKLFIMFGVLKTFYFPNFLNSNFNTDQERSEYVLLNLTEFK